MSNTLNATVRSSSGKGAARKTRRDGKIPAVLYGPENEPVPVDIDPDQLVRIFRKTNDRNTVVDVEIDGTSVPTLVQDVQRHPVSRDILHVDFYRVSKSKPVEVMVPVTTVGRPAGAVLGGRLRLIRRVVRTRCVYDRIPSSFVVDISPMNIGDMVKASEIATPEGVEIVFDHDFNVLTVYGKKQRGGAAGAPSGKK
ncbi:MAG: 50S ribosomal protein L25 [Alphaproteobacteria bacterium]|nr:50S ribosomal protein L25 [Alphaproteobacteria bacterium]